MNFDFAAVSCIFVFLIASVSAQNYCDPSYCGAGLTHVGCGNGGLVSKCGSDMKLIDFTDDLKSYTLDVHNNLRNEIASGKLKGFPAASQMATMGRWASQPGYVLNILVLQDS